MFKVWQNEKCNQVLLHGISNYRIHVNTMSHIIQDGSLGIFDLKKQVKEKGRVVSSWTKPLYVLPSKLISNKKSFIDALPTP